MPRLGVFGRQLNFSTFTPRAETEITTRAAEHAPTFHHLPIADRAAGSGCMERAVFRVIVDRRSGSEFHVSIPPPDGVGW
jgi:hypothetical protein